MVYITLQAWPPYDGRGLYELSGMKRIERAACSGMRGYVCGRSSSHSGEMVRGRDETRQHRMRGYQRNESTRRKEEENTTDTTVAYYELYSEPDTIHALLLRVRSFVLIGSVCHDAIYRQAPNAFTVSCDDMYSVRMCTQRKNCNHKYIIVMR